MSYAVIQTGGKQYRVAPGENFDVEKLSAQPGETITFSEVLLAAEGEKVAIGTPFLEKASVVAEVVDQHKDDKVIAYKFHRRKGYHRTVGHRRQLTKLTIKSIEF